MSAFYSFRYHDRVQLLTDGGFFDEEGVLRTVGRKVFPFGNLPIAVAGRGSPVGRVFGIIEDMMAFVAGMEPFDDIDLALSALRGFFRKLESSRDPFDAEFLIAAYSAQRGRVISSSPATSIGGSNHLSFCPLAPKSALARRLISATSNICVSLRKTSPHRISPSAMEWKSWGR